MPSDEILEYTVNSPEDEQINKKFFEASFESNYMILNLGTIFLMFLLLPILLVCLTCTRPCKNCCCCSSFKTKHKAMESNMRGNTWIRFILEGTLDIAICAALNYIYNKNSQKSFRWDTPFQAVNSLSFIVLTILLVLFPVWAMWFYCYNFERWEENDFE